MSKLGRLPPLNALVVPEAASRHGSFSRAGIELRLTQSAVRRQICKLEAFIGSKLFTRAVHGVHLTHIGEAYAADISRVLGEVVAVTEGVRSRSGATADGNEALTGDLYRAGIVMAEVCDGLEVGHQLAGQPHQLDIAACLALQLPARS